jgi:uncharacterized protein (DUF488 family)
MKEIWTIGHSTRSEQEFLEILKSWQIQELVDVRTLPGSRRYPHFNQENLSRSLGDIGINYRHAPELGGRRKPRPDSSNTAWRNNSFRGYADYMETPEFINAIAQLEELALKTRVAYMCSEAVWWKCHRALISDTLKTKGWKVLHIADNTRVQEHPYTSPAREAQGRLFTE